MGRLVKKALPRRSAIGRAVVLSVAMAMTVTFGGSPARAGTTVEDTGSATRTALPVLASLIALLKGDKEGFVQHAASITVSTGITLGLKEIVRSPRPNGLNNRSFPSGHTAQAFASASFLDHRYGWQYGLPAYAAATFVAFSRVNSDNHRIRDVAAGAVLSWGVSHFIVDPDDRVTVEGEVNPRRALLRLRVKW